MDVHLGGFDGADRVVFGRHDRRPIRVRMLGFFTEKWGLAITVARVIKE